MVIPCLNDAALLDRCLRSLKRQSRRPDVVVVVDNGSTDDTASVAKQHHARVISEPRRGITWAAAAGYDEASRLGAQFIVRTDADAWFPLEYLETVDKAWRAAPQSAVGLTGTGRFDRTPALLSLAYMGVYRWSVGSALGHPPFFGTSCSFRAQWWETVRGELDLADTDSHDDVQLSFAVRADETVRFIPELVVGMDSRALHGWRQVRRRLWRGWHSMMRGFAVSPPWRRLPQRIRQSGHIPSDER